MHTSIFSLTAAIAIVIGVAALAPQRAEAMAASSDLRAITGDAVVVKAACARVCGPRGCVRRCGVWRRW